MYNFMVQELNHTRVMGLEEEIQKSVEVTWAMTVLIAHLDNLLFQRMT